MSRPSPGLRAAILLGLVLAAVAALPRPAAAKLAPSKFAELLAESELICRVRVTEANVDRYRGHAVVEVTQVLKGERPTAPIRLDFGGEVHDQLINVVGEERLLFLKKVDGKWTGTHYGRSYWPLVPAADPAVGWSPGSSTPCTCSASRAGTPGSSARRASPRAPARSRRARR